MNGVASGENDKEGEGGGQLAHRRDMLKDDDCWEYGCRGEAKAHVGIPRPRARPCASAASAPCVRMAVAVQSSRAR
jgi:hypothetical protein